MPTVTRRLSFNPVSVVVNSAIMNTSQEETTFEGMIHWRNVFQASEHNDMEGVKYFIEDLRVNISGRNDDNETPAHCAARKCNAPVLRYLLQRDPTLQDMRDIFNQNVLHLVTLCGSLELVKYLVIEREMDMYEPSNVHLGNGAVHLAAYAGWVHILRYFVDEKHVDVNLRNRMNQTLAITAALNKKVRVIKYLLEHCKADMFLTDNNDDNILLISARIGDMSVPLYLLEEKQLVFDLNQKDRFGGTVVHLAARHDNLVLLRYFVGEKNADIHALDTSGRTPLHEAAEQEHLEVVKYLVEQGANTTLKDNYGQKPSQLTKKKDLVEYLEQHQPPQRRRRNLQESFFIPWIRDYSLDRKFIGGKSEVQTWTSQPFFNSFLTLIAWLYNVNESSFRSTLTPPEIIRNRIDMSAIDAVHAFSVFEEC